MSGRTRLRWGAGPARALALWLILAVAAPALRAGDGAFELISASEARREAVAAAAAPEEFRTRAGPTAGRDTAIRVVEPVGNTGPVVAPLRIELAFTPAPGARIVPDSFRVLYGVLKIDLTDRLRPHARVSERGVVVDGAQVPEGLHRLIVQVADDRGRTAEQELRLRVGAAS